MPRFDRLCDGNESGPRSIERGPHFAIFEHFFACKGPTTATQPVATSGYGLVHVDRVRVATNLDKLGTYALRHPSLPAETADPDCPSRYLPQPSPVHPSETRATEVGHSSTLE